VLDSRCTNHMTGEKRMFTSFEMNDCESDCITFDDNRQDQVIGFGKIVITTKHSISKVLLAELLDYNFLSVSHLCEIGYNCLFTDNGVTVFRIMVSAYLIIYWSQIRPHSKNRICSS
jgi:hypothetical protein